MTCQFLLVELTKRFKSDKIQAEKDSETSTLFIAVRCVGDLLLPLFTGLNFSELLDK